MRRNLAPVVDLNFLDGYLFRFLQEIDNPGDTAASSLGGYLSRFLQKIDSRRGDPSASGLGDYYRIRVDDRLGGLLEYEESIARYLLGNYGDARVLHAGIGVGSLACALSCNGIRVLGVERDAARLNLAHRLRDAMIRVWPEVGDRYKIISGSYPKAVMNSDWKGANVILLFTNVGAGWTEDDMATIIASMLRFGQVFLDLRLFGWVRDTEAERDELFGRIRASAQEAERLPNVARGVDLARFMFC